MFFVFLKRMSSFMSIIYYLLFDLLTYFLRIILYYKNSKIKHLIDDTNYLSLIFLKFCKCGGYKKKKYNLIVELLKFVSNKKILSRVVTLIYNQVCC